MQIAINVRDFVPVIAIGGVFPRLLITNQIDASTARLVRRDERSREFVGLKPWQIPRECFRVVYPNKASAFVGRTIVNAPIIRVSIVMLVNVMLVNVGFGAGIAKSVNRSRGHIVLHWLLTVRVSHI
jgi:hypothetical protein